MKVFSFSISHLSAGAIALMESQIETMRGSIAALKGRAPEKKPKKERKKEKAAPVASSSKAAKPPKASNGGNKRKGKKAVADDDVLSFEQKKDLSEAIQKLDGTKLERVIQIIHEGVPEIRDVSVLSCRFCLNFIYNNQYDAHRARKKSNWRSTCCQPQFSQNFITLSFGPCGRLLQNAAGWAREQEQAG